MGAANTAVNSAITAKYQAGARALPVRFVSHTAMTGNVPPKTTAAKVKLTAKPEVRRCGGKASTKYTVEPPFIHACTASSTKRAAMTTTAVAPCISMNNGTVSVAASKLPVISNGLRPMRSESALKNP